MKMMNKLRLMPILMAVAMVLSMMPLQASAATTYKYVTVLSGEGSGNVSVYKELRTGGWTLVDEGESVEVNARLKIIATPDKYSDIDNNNVAISTSGLTGTSFQAGEKTIKTPLIFAEDENRQIIKGEFIYDPSRLSAEHDSWKNGDKGIVISFKNINTDTRSIGSQKTGEGQLSCYLKDGWKITPARRAREGDTILVSAEAKSGWTLSGLYLLEKDAAAPSAPYEITSAFSVSALNDCMYQVAMPYHDAKVYAVFTREDTPGDEPEENDTWTVTFDKNGGSGSMEAAYVDKGQEYEIPDCDFDPPEGLAFRGWKGAAVRNIATTHLLDRVAEAYGQECVEVPVGFKHISAGMEAHDAIIGGESSGGLTVRGHIFGKDGLYAASLLLEMLCVTGKPLSALVREIYDRFGETHMAEYDWALTPAVKEEIYQRIMVAHELPEMPLPVEKVSWLDGCKLYLRGGWVILRFSGTEPRVRIFAEAETLSAAQELAEKMAVFAGLKFPPEGV